MHDLWILSMSRIRAFALTVSSRPDAADALLAMALPDRIEAVAARLGAMPDSEHSYIRRVDDASPWQLSNLRWGRLHCTSEQHESREQFSPTARCPKCSSWRTIIYSVYQRGATRSHECKKCGARFRTAMLEHEQPPRPSSRRRLKEVAEASGISAKVIGLRLADGWTLERAISQPVQKRKHPIRRKQDE